MKNNHLKLKALKLVKIVMGGLLLAGCESQSQLPQQNNAGGPPGNYHVEQFPPSPVSQEMQSQPLPQQLQY